MKLLCTDLDRTLIPNGEQPESLHARPILWHLLNTHAVALAYVSGRDFLRVQDAIREYCLPVPDVIVADVGTSLYTRHEDNWIRNAQWDVSVSNDWCGHDTFGVEGILANINELESQEADRQSSYKRSYYYAQSADESELAELVRGYLANNGIKASLVMSHDPEKAVGLLDVLPQSATKRGAVSHLQSMLQLPHDEIMFAGDSGNDVTAICARQLGVLVANADSVTRAAVLDHMQDSSISASIYLARGDLTVAGLDALNGNYSAGIIEGLIHFRPQWLEHLKDADWLNSALRNSESSSRRSA
ncbi:MAG: HAD-IIB family hydrolase [Granulosicoccus sp.]